MFRQQKWEITRLINETNETNEGIQTENMSKPWTLQSREVCREKYIFSKIESIGAH